MPESLKNVLLVMSSGGYLTPPDQNADGQTEQQKKLWTETETRLNRFLPDLMPELFPETVEEAEPSAPEKKPKDDDAAEPEMAGTVADQASGTEEKEAEAEEVKPAAET